MVEQAIEILKQSNQTLVWLNALVTPLRDLVPSSPRDEKMKALLEELKGMGIVDNTTGFWSHSTIPGFYYPTSLSLNKQWFEQNCTPRKRSHKQSGQLNLFTV